MRIHKKFERARAGRILTDLLFPRRCPVCDRPVKPFGRDICDGCRGTLILIREPRCLKCGKQLQDAGAEYCYDCSRRRHVYTKGAALYSYACIRQTIYRFKYAGRREYADFLGRALAENLGTLIRSWHPEALVPVPLHPDRERIRGYNQAALLAQRGAVVGGHGRVRALAEDRAAQGQGADLAHGTGHGIRHDAAPGRGGGGAPSRRAHPRGRGRAAPRAT